MLAIHVFPGPYSAYLTVYKEKSPHSQSCGFSSSHVQMWELDPKEGWELKSWCFPSMVLEKTLESSLDCKEIKPVNPKGNSPEYSLESLTLKLKLRYFGHLMWRTDSSVSWKRHWCWERLKVGREGDDTRWDGWMASLTQWMWVWGSSRRWWWKGKPVCFSPWGWKELDMAEWLNSTTDKLFWVPWKAQAIE